MGHHYVPQEYLRGFSADDNPNGLWQFDKQTASFTKEPVSIKQIAQQRQFYDEQTERDLNTYVEIPGNAVLEKLRAFNLDLDTAERLAISVYIATMMKRVPHHRDKCYAMAPQSLSSVMSKVKEQIDTFRAGGQISQDIAERRLKEIDEFAAKFLQQLPDQIEEQIRSPWPSQDMVTLIYAMSWRFLMAAAGNKFVTSDNPAFYFECYGLGKKQSELTFPISPTLALFGNWQPLSNFTKPFHRSQFVKEANRRIIVGARRFIYHRSSPTWISGVAKREVKHLSRIIWPPS